jgi:ATP-dependent RNA circularization protein (DNA/RNA ligase family)
VKEYHKIQSIFKRDERTHKFIEGQYSLLEFEYLRNNQWLATEKIDGTNVRVEWDIANQTVTYGGRTDNAQTPTFLLNKLQEIFPKEKFVSLYPDISMCLYGEGYGARIQKGGGNYISNGCNFSLFDVLIGDMWLQREDVIDIASKLEIPFVPEVGRYTLETVVNAIKLRNLTSTFGDFLMEGLVLKPTTELSDRRGHRIVTKIKHVDF